MKVLDVIWPQIMMLLYWKDGEKGSCERAKIIAMHDKSRDKLEKLRDSSICLLFRNIESNNNK